MTSKAKIKRVGLLTSGGDAPGMNAAIRAVVRMAHYKDIQPVGFKRGYAGLIQNDWIDLGPRDVSNILQRGGTVLKTCRCPEFEKKAGILKAVSVLEQNEMDALIVIGGNGTYRGAIELGKHWRGRIAGIPGTIDNDLYGTDSTIGYDTAVNTALESIDKIRDTADSHDRFFLVEVMGRHAGYIALNVGIAGGAEEVLIPEVKTPVSKVCHNLFAGKGKGKTSSILVVAEGNKTGGALQTARELEALCGNEYRVVILGHVQRGGSPSAADRILGTELGAFALETLLKGKTGVAVGKVGGKLINTPLPTACVKRKKLDSYLLKLLPILAT